MLPHTNNSTYKTNEGDFMEIVVNQDFRNFYNKQSNYHNVKFLEELIRNKVKRLTAKSKNTENKTNGYTCFDAGIMGDFISKLCFLFMMFTTNAITVFADGGLSTIYNSDAFVGNVKWLEKFNWVGTCVQAFISVLALFIGVSVAVQIFITVVYFANRPLWDTVFEIKESKKGVLNYTFNGAFQGGFKSTASRGSDVIGDYIMLLLPNVKKFSEMGASDADQEQTLVTWLMGSFINKVILFLVVSMVYSGSLMKGYLMVVDGFGVIADEIVETDLAGIIENQINKNNAKNYQFAVGSTGKGFDALQGSFAKKLYASILKNSKDVTTNTRHSVGNAIETYISQNLTKENVARYIVPKINDYSKITDSEWERVKIEIVANSAPSATDSLTVKASDLGLQNSHDTATVYHIYFSLNRRDDTTSYWKVPDSE